MSKNAADWIQHKLAAEKAGITPSMLTRWIDQKRVRYTGNPRDRRVTLVYWPDIEKILNEEPQPEI